CSGSKLIPRLSALTSPDKATVIAAIMNRFSTFGRRCDPRAARWTQSSTCVVIGFPFVADFGIHRLRGGVGEPRSIKHKRQTRKRCAAYAGETDARWVVVQLGA